MQIKKIVVGTLQTNCYLFISDKEMAVIDPGDETQKILTGIKNAGARPKFIISTHRHFDHISALKKVEEATGAKTLESLREGDEIKIGKEKLRVLRTPGHAEEAICLLGNGILFSGDTLFAEGYGRTDLPGGSKKKMRESLERLFREIPKGTKIYPGHGKSFVKEA